MDFRQLHAAILLSFSLLNITQTANAAPAEDVRVNMHKYEKLADRYYARARELNGLPIGTVWNDVDQVAHSCSIISQLLNLGETVLPSEVQSDPGLSSTDTTSLKIYGNSLSNYAWSAKRLLKASRYQLISEWNLDCTGRFGLTLFIPIDGPSELFTLENGGKVLRFLGDIDRGIFPLFQAYLASSPGVEFVALGSGGGSIQDAFQIGMLIRQKGINTTLYNGCYSACTLVFLAGVERHIARPYPPLGFHRASVRGVQLDDSADIYMLIYAYANQMAGNGAIIIAAMRQANSDDMFYLTVSQLCDFNVATWVQGMCFQRR